MDKRVYKLAEYECVFKIIIERLLKSKSTEEEMNMKQAKLIQSHRLNSSTLPIGTIVIILEDDKNNPCYWVQFGYNEFYIEKMKVRVL